MKKTFVVAAVALLGIAAMGAATSGDAEATPNEKVTICHATPAEPKPYTVNHVDESSVDEQNNNYLNGHGDHEGDIIPPFRSFEGRNWTVQNQATWRNGCEVPPPPPPPPPEVTELTPEAPTLGPPTCDALREVVLPPTVEGLLYTPVEKDGSITVTVVATEGFVLAEGATTSWTFTVEELAKLPATDQACIEPVPTTQPPAETPVVAVLPPTQPAAETAVLAAVPAAVPAAAAPAAAPTALPTTGSESWAIFLIGLTSLLGGAALVKLSRRPA